MSRRLPEEIEIAADFATSAVPKDAKGQRPDGRVRKPYRIQLVTPMFGGGGDPGEPDPATPISAKAIRGQLRFWWRATRGVHFATAADLAKVEGRLFGTAETSSPLDVCVTIERPGKCGPCAIYRPNANSGRSETQWDSRFGTRRPPVLAYALFPFQGSPPDNAKPKKPALMGTDIAFHVELAFPRIDRPREEKPLDFEMEYGAAVWAWLNFGGVGARTRRGCGALYCETVAPANAKSLKMWWNDACKRFGWDLNGGSAWPTLTGLTYVKPSPADHVAAWESTIEVMRDYRQGETGRKPGRPRPGRSHWPEPETIRDLTVKWPGQHQRLEQIPCNAFPRAELGLPIVFEFKGDKAGDPPKTELQAALNRGPANRFASPFILKPLAISPKQSVPLILMLNGPRPANALLKHPSDGSDIGECRVQGKDLATYPKSPLGRPEGDVSRPQRSSAGSAIEGFRALAQEPRFGFRKIGDL